VMFYVCSMLRIYKQDPPDRNIPFVNYVKYSNVIFDKVTWGLHIGVIKAKGFGTFIVCSYMSDQIQGLQNIS
jgi:hypothetical protein